MGKIIDEPMIGDIAVDGPRSARFDTPDDRGGILTAPMYADDRPILELLALGLPMLDLRYAATRVFIKGNVEAIDEIGSVSLDEPRNVLSEMFARLGDEVAKAAKHFIAHLVVRRDLACVGESSEAGVEIFSVSFEPEVERHVVDSSGEVVDLAIIHS